jgi:hypothetical protein
VSTKEVSESNATFIKPKSASRAWRSSLISMFAYKW